MTRFVIAQLAGGTVLGGSLEGRRLLTTLISALGAGPLGPQPVFLDFAGVSVATASFLRESILGFRDHVRRRHSTLYPVIANAGPAVCDDLALLLKAEGDALLICNLDARGKASKITVLGKLDPKQQRTLDLVLERGATDARTLMEEFSSSENIQQTAWNNRLASLAALGLIIETSDGKTKRYSPVLQGGGHGR